MLPQCHHISTAVFQFWGSILGCFQTQTRHKFEMLRTSPLSKPSLSCKHVAAVSRRGNCTPLPSSAKGGEFILFDWKMGISKDWRFPTVSFAAWPYTACIDLHLFETAGNKVELLGPGQWAMIFQWQVSFFFLFFHEFWMVYCIIIWCHVLRSLFASAESELARAFELVAGLL